MVYNEYSLVLSGASAKIFLHIGAMQAIHDQNIRINKYAGSSSGAIITSILACGINPNDLKQAIFDINFNKIIKENKFFYSPILSLFWNGYLSSGKMLKQYLFNIIGNKRFKDIDKDLYIIAFNLTQKRSEIFCYELTPDLKIIDAVMASATLPLLFPPYKINNNIYIDGAIAKHLPTDLPFLGKKIIGHLVTDNNLGIIEINGLIDYSAKVLDVLFSGMQGESIVDAELIGNMQYIACSYYDIGLFDFNISKQQKMEMFDIGYHSMEKKIKVDNIREI